MRRRRKEDREGCIPIEVDGVGGSDTNKRGLEPRVQRRRSFIADHSFECIPRSFIFTYYLLFLTSSSYYLCSAFWSFDLLQQQPRELELKMIRDRNMDILCIKYLVT